MQNSLPNLESTNKSEFNLKEQLFFYSQYWKWFVVSVIFFLFISFIYLRYYVVEYGVTSTILIKDEKKGGSSEFSAISDMNLFSSKNNVDNEIAILKSRTLSQNVVELLELDVSYFTNDRLVDIELYNDSPVKILFYNKSKNYNKIYKKLTIKIESNTKYSLSDLDNKKSKRYTFGQKVHNQLGTFTVIKNNESTKNGPVVINIVKFPLESKATAFRSSLTIILIDKTNVINLSNSDQIPQRGFDFLDELINQYNLDAIKERNQVANFTKDFIDQRLQIITKELGGVEEEQETFKKTRNLTSLEADSELSLAQATDYDRSVLNVETELKVSEFMLNQISKIKSNELIPANILSSNEGSNFGIEQYNELILDRRRQLKSATEDNPVIRNIDSQLNSVKLNIVEGLKNKQKDLKINILDLSNARSHFDNKVGKVPSNDRYYNEIARQQHVKESLYLYLLQKREETELSLAASSPKAKIIDKAYLTGTISINKLVFYLVGLALGLILPFGILFFMNFMDTKIKSINDIVGKVSIPYLGDLPRNKDNQNIIVANNRSSFSEAIRMIRTNLEFMLAHVAKNKCKTIFVTSSISKEGKTFCAINLAATIALSEKRVLIIGLDIRNPKLNNYIDLPSKGLTNYLSKQDGYIIDYIINVDSIPNLYALASGVTPPNPVELLMNDKINVMFDELKLQFDYIIVDTAPVSLVTDTLLIANNADAFIYVMRANYLEKEMLQFAETLYKERKLPNMSVLLNDTEANKTYGYGHTYGYELDSELETSWYKKLYARCIKKYLKN
jgi:tyrosine-protein kinase Etk/Wzc